ncbi:TonB-dependent receptor [Agarilytica rhodophyticola]|uniref:TonB-dependent receptor n=1 Tax=Agarilytica rhodophyticola TaxID=1737490 RepID=UPI000B34266F|nr:TonB-dependent receptor [Agarilytica rhodophyticola]
MPRGLNSIFSKKIPYFTLAKAISLVLISNRVYADIAQAQSTEQNHNIETVTVVGSTTNSVITPEELNKYQANDLADVFRYIPSVSVGGSLGIAQKIYVRGMEDTLLNITVDGALQTGTLFHHIGRVSIEPELLKQVEVQAGAGEATSGAGAIGGAIRFQTKDTDDLLDEGQNIGGLIKAGYFSNDGYRASTSVYGRVNDNWGLLASYVHVDRDNMEDGNGNELFGTSAKQTLAFVKTSGAIGDLQKLTFSYEQREENGDFGARPNWPTLASAPLFPINAKRQTLVANHHFDLNDLVNLKTTFYNTKAEVEQDRFDRWGLYGAEIKTFGFDIRNTSVIDKNTITYGIDYRDDSVVSQYLAESSVWMPWAWNPQVGRFEEEGQVQGAYVQNHWQYNNNVLMSFGLRYDHYELEQITYQDETSSDGFSPNIGLVYNLHPQWELTVGYAEALRGKEVGDAFTLERATDRISFTSELEAETVANTEMGLRYNNGNLDVLASVYHTEIDDVILDQLGRGPVPQAGTYYENVGTLETYGFELNASYQWNNLSITASYSNNDSELNNNTVEGYEHIGLANARGDTWNIDLIYTVSDTLELGWNLIYVEELANIEVLQRAVEIGWIDTTQYVHKPTYSTHDVYLQWLPWANERLIFNLAIQNLFNKQYRDHSSVADYNHIPGWEGIAGLYEAGRDIRLSSSFRF